MIVPPLIFKYTVGLYRIAKKVASYIMLSSEVKFKVCGHIYFNSQFPSHASAGILHSSWGSHLHLEGKNRSSEGCYHHLFYLFMLNVIHNLFLYRNDFDPLSPFPRFKLYPPEQSLPLPLIVMKLLPPLHAMILLQHLTTEGTQTSSFASGS